MVLKPDFDPEMFYYMSVRMVKGDCLLRHTDFDNSYDLIKGNKPAEPVRMDYVMGGRRKAVMMGGGQVYLLSERLIDELKKHNFSGWDTFTVNATGKAGEPIDGYDGLFIQGKAGPVDLKYTEEIFKPNPMGVLKPVYVGPGFDPQTWDGSDIFSLENTILIIVSHQVKEVFEKLKTNNVKFENVKEYTQSP